MGAPFLASFARSGAFRPAQHSPRICQCGDSRPQLSRSSQARRLLAQRPQNEPPLIVPRLIVQRVRNFRTQFVGSEIDAIEIPSIGIGLTLAPNNPFDRRGADPLIEAFLTKPSVESSG